ncbi:MAG: RNA polymerase sigma factor [Chloroflexota bacterium]
MKSEMTHTSGHREKESINLVNLQTGQPSDDGGAVHRIRQDCMDFGTCYREYVLRIYRYFYRQLGNQADSEDLTAATFMKALSSISRYREQGSFASWLFSIAHHTLADYQRHRHHEIGLDSLAVALPDNNLPTEAQVLRAETSRLLHTLIQQLPADQREALALRFFGGLHIAEVATVLGRSDGAVKMLIHRAIETLRAAYPKEEES